MNVTHAPPTLLCTTVTHSLASLVVAPGIVLFNQIDADHSGQIDKEELKKLLMSLPKKKPKEPEGGWPNGEAPKFVPFDELVDSLDTDKDGQVRCLSLYCLLRCQF